MSSRADRTHFGENSNFPAVRCFAFAGFLLFSPHATQRDAYSISLDRAVAIARRTRVKAISKAARSVLEVRIENRPRDTTWSATRERRTVIRAPRADPPTVALERRAANDVSFGMSRTVENHWHKRCASVSSCPARHLQFLFLRSPVYRIIGKINNVKL